MTDRLHRLRQALSVAAHNGTLDVNVYASDLESLIALADSVTAFLKLRDEWLGKRLAESADKTFDELMKASEAHAQRENDAEGAVRTAMHALIGTTPEPAP